MNSCSHYMNMIEMLMQIIARKHLQSFWSAHPETKVFLTRWETVMKAGSWKTMSDLQTAFPKATVLNADRMRFEVHHNDYRMIVAFDLTRQIAFIKFIGTHKQYDAINALTVSMF